MLINKLTLFQPDNQQICLLFLIKDLNEFDKCF